jgi:hypothetical protein
MPRAGMRATIQDREPIVTGAVTPVMTRTGRTRVVAHTTGTGATPATRWGHTRGTRVTRLTASMEVTPGTTPTERVAVITEHTGEVTGDTRETTVERIRTPTLRPTRSRLRR